MSTHSATLYKFFCGLRLCLHSYSILVNRWNLDRPLKIPSLSRESFGMHAQNGMLQKSTLSGAFWSSRKERILLVYGGPAMDGQRIANTRRYFALIHPLCGFQRKFSFLLSAKLLYTKYFKEVMLYIYAR